MCLRVPRRFLNPLSRFPKMHVMSQSHTLDLSRPADPAIPSCADTAAEASTPLGAWRVGSNPHVTTFVDNQWYTDGEATPGYRVVNFNLPLPFNQPAITSPGFEDLLVDTKLVLWACGVAKRDRTGVRTPSLWGCFKPLLGWMARENLPDFSYLTRDRIWGDGGLDNSRTYVAALLEHLGGDPQDVSHANACRYMRAFSHLREAYDVLEAFERPTLPEYPFNNGEFSRLLIEIAQKESEDWRPIPDEVLIPMLNASQDWLGQKADDVLAALEIWADARREARSAMKSERTAKRAVSHALFNFSFSCDATGRPWHAPLFEERDTLGDPVAGMGGGIGELTALVRRVQSAGMIALQQTSGMRSGELLALRSTLRRDGTPECIEERFVAKGAKTLLLLHSVTSKLNGGELEAHEFVVGMKVNLPHISAPIVRAQRAVEVLLRLSSLLKKIAPSGATEDLLLVTWSGAKLPGWKNTLRPFSNQTHNRAIRTFLADTCAEALSKLPDNSVKLVQDGWLGLWRDTSGAIFHTHQLRKSFANFAFSAEPGLLPEIRAQYGHVSQAMTARYANNDYQIREMNEMEAHMATEHIVTALSESELGGKGAEEIHRRPDWRELRRLFDQAEAEERHEVVVQWLKETGRLIDEEYRPTIDGRKVKRHVLRTSISNAAHGLCAAVSIRGDEMECRKAGGTTGRLLDGLGADKRFRTPSRCLGCANYVILPQHRAFWEDRFIRATDTIAFMKADKGLRSVSDTHIAEAKQARAWLKSIGMSDFELDEIADRAECEGKMRWEKVNA